MSTYLDMWSEIRKMKFKDVNRVLYDLGPPKGTQVYFRGVVVSDVDLVEALKSFREDLMRDTGHPSVDHRQPNFD